jgi:hypothetical protein
LYNIKIGGKYLRYEAPDISSSEDTDAYTEIYIEYLPYSYYTDIVKISGTSFSKSYYDHTVMNQIYFDFDNRNLETLNRTPVSLEYLQAFTIKFKMENRYLYNNNSSFSVDTSLSGDDKVNVVKLDLSDFKKYQFFLFKPNPSSLYFDAVKLSSFENLNMIIDDVYINVRNINNLKYSTGFNRVFSPGSIPPATDVHIGPINLRDILVLRGIPVYIGTPQVVLFLIKNIAEYSNIAVTGVTIRQFLNQSNRKNSAITIRIEVTQNNLPPPPSFPNYTAFNFTVYIRLYEKHTNNEIFTVSTNTYTALDNYIYPPWTVVLGRSRRNDTTTKRHTHIA